MNLDKIETIEIIIKAASASLQMAMPVSISTWGSIVHSNASQLGVKLSQPLGFSSNLWVPGLKKLLVLQRKKLFPVDSLETKENEKKVDLHIVILHGRGIENWLKKTYTLFF